MHEHSGTDCSTRGARTHHWAGRRFAWFCGCESAGMKREALERCAPPVPPGESPWHARQDIVQWLEDL